MKNTLISSLTKEQLRSYVRQLPTVLGNVDKMNKTKLLVYVKDLSYSQLKEYFPKKDKV